MWYEVETLIKNIFLAQGSDDAAVSVEAFNKDLNKHYDH